MMWALFWVNQAGWAYAWWCADQRRQLYKPWRKISV